MKRLYILSLLIISILSVSCGFHKKEIKTGSKYGEPEKVGNYYVYDYPTSNVHSGKNKVQGIVMHHTATESLATSLAIMAGEKPKGQVSCHVVIDADGTRYVLAPPEAITWHAGLSCLNGKENCNRFCVGIEFQGNTAKQPLTDAQIESAIDYCIPIMKKYGLTEKDIVSHGQIRREYLKQHPKSQVAPKGDITETELQRFKKELRKHL